MGESSGEVSLRSLFEPGELEPRMSGLDYRGAIRLICRGGWPSGLGLDDQTAMLIPRQYAQSLAEFDLPRPDGVSRSPAKVMALLRSLARHTSTQAAMRTIHSDIAGSTDGDESVGMSTLRDHLTALRRVFAVDDLPPWVYSLRSKSQLRMAPTHHLADPSLAAAVLGATPQSLHEDPETTGLLFESLVVRDLRVYAEAMGGAVAHYRDNKGLEADAIVTDDEGRWGAVEVKLGAQQSDAAAATLLRLRRKLEGEVNPPAFLAVVTATGGVAHTREDGVHVIPIACLGP
jgi:predicted AAA+ superfamily ATPase